MNNKLIEEIKDYLNNVNISWDKSEVINDNIIKGIEELKGKSLDELAVTELDENGKEKFLMDLEWYTTKIFNNTIKLVCNVLDSYKEN